MPLTRHGGGLASLTAMRALGDGMTKPRVKPDGDAILDWRKRPDGTMGAECGPFQLLVYPLTPGAYARFVVIRRANGGQPSGALLQSGTRDGLEAAIRGVEAAARRLIAALEPDAVPRP